MRSINLLSVLINITSFFGLKVIFSIELLRGGEPISNVLEMPQIIVKACISRHVCAHACVCKFTCTPTCSGEDRGQH